LNVNKEEEFQRIQDEQLAKVLKKLELATLEPSSTSMLADTPVEDPWAELEKLKKEKQRLLKLLADTEKLSQSSPEMSSSPEPPPLPGVSEVDLQRRPTFNTRAQSRANRILPNIVTGEALETLSRPPLKAPISAPIQPVEKAMDVTTLPPAPESPPDVNAYVPPSYTQPQSFYNGSEPEAQKEKSKLFSFGRKRTPSPHEIKSDKSNMTQMITNSTTRLDGAQTLDLYRENAQRSKNVKVQYEFARYLVETAQEMPNITLHDRQAKEALLEEGFRLLRKLAQSSCSEAQWYLAVGYAHDQDFERSFALWLQASKHNHPASAYEVARSYELGLGVKRDMRRAAQFYTKSASSGYVPSMYRVGLAYLYGEVGLKRDAKAALKWLKLGATAGDAQSKFTLATVYEAGAPPVVYQDLIYARTLVAEAAEKGWAPAQVRLGKAYEYGHLGLAVNPAQSIYWYRQSAEQGNAEGQFALAGWNLTGADGILPQSSRDAILWTLKAAEQGLPKAEHALAYFYETGMGCTANPALAKQWYQQAAHHGDARAVARLQNLGNVDAVQIERKGTISMEKLQPEKRDQCRIM
jgi:TPR repeat protein